MCTLALGFQLDRRWPVVVAANRDELLDRPSQGWAVRLPRQARRQREPDPVGGEPVEPRHGVGESPLHAAPLDLQAGGTWIGVSPRGLFAGITNHYVRFDGAPDPTLRSRGELVPMALGAPDAAAAAQALQGLDASRWNPFHLVVADARDAFLFWYDGEEQGLDRLAPGLHLVTESDREGRGARAGWLRARWPSHPSLERLRELLVHHGDPPPAGAATCIHADPVYGTRSSAILRLAPDLGSSELFVAEGRPCLVPHQDRSDLLLALSRHP
jgi:uncharacterized protein with NRDE domain